MMRIAAVKSGAGTNWQCKMKPCHYSWWLLRVNLQHLAVWSQAVEVPSQMVHDVVYLIFPTAAASMEEPSKVSQHFFCWWAPSHALSEASIITSQQEATSASGWFSWVRFFGRLVRHWRRLECPSNGCEEKPDKLSTNEQNRSAGGPQHQVSWTVSAHIECLFDPKWILLFPCIFHGLKHLSISWIICHGYLTLE